MRTARGNPIVLAKPIDTKKKRICRYIKEGVVFRSATLDNLNKAEVDKFISDHKINTILDLRTR